MPNELDETSGPVNRSGRDLNVLDKQLGVDVAFGTKLIEPCLWVSGVAIGFGAGFAITEDYTIGILGIVLGLIPGLIFWVLKARALAYLRKLQQKIQADASQIDNYLEQRVIILQNLVGLLTKSIDVDKDVMKSIAALRSGNSPNGDQDRNQNSALLEGAFSRINVAFEAYPNLKSQDNIAEAIRQNAYLQREITAARTLYNDSANSWNQEIYSWPVKQLVAARAGYTTRIPFIASQETRDLARGNFFQ